jgi:pilus assembly protein Flp/PilA
MLAETGDQAMSKFVTRFAKNESGATAIEYGLIVALIAVFIIGAVTSVGSNLSTQFNAVASKL